MESTPKLFKPYRALGLYSSGIPHCTRYHQKHQEHYVFLAVGKVFHTYNCSKLGITQVSNAHPHDISCIAADRFLVYTGCKKTVRAFQHNRQVQYIYEGHESDVHILLPFSEHLISIDRSSAVKIWHIKSQELFLDMEFDNSTFQITAVLHPSTYVNKILLASSQGTMQLWNIRKNMMIYQFKDQTDTSSIVCMTQSPAIDVVAIGRSSGNIVVHNIKLDQEIMRFRQNEGPVVGVAFRSDGPSTMISGGGGKISVWDLEEKRLLSVMEYVHDTEIAGMTFLPGQPLLLTNAADNSIKVWAFDQSDGTGRLLRKRAGHSAPPTKIRFHDEMNVISAAQDSTMRIFSLDHEEKNRSMGQASMNRAKARKAAVRFDEKKMPPVMDFFTTSTREREWDNIIAYHHKTAVATTWNYQCSRMGSHKLLHDRFRNHQSLTEDKKSKIKDNVAVYVTAVTMTQCGNFCLIGYNTGDVDLFNMQSGIHRGRFIENKEELPRAHVRPISGIVVNYLNQVVVTAGCDNLLKFWRFKTKQLMGKIELKSMPSLMNLQGENSLLAVALDDFCIQVYDLDTRKLARQFPGFHGAITDMTWSADGLWIVAASMDCTIRTYEMSSATMIDCFLVDSAAVTLALSPNSDVLVTCHVDDLGIYLWSNSSIFGKVSLTPLPLDFHPGNAIHLPSTDAGDAEADDTDIVIVEDVNESITGKEENKCSTEPLSDQMVTLAKLPSAKWAHLLSLDVIKKRNKPKEPVTQSKAAPFFLPTISGLNPTFDITEEKKESKIIKPTTLKPLSEFALLLQSDNVLTNSPSTTMNRLKELGPSAIDVEIRSLAPDFGGSLELMSSFLSLILAMLKSKRDFELVESVLALFLKLHVETVATEPTLIKMLEEIEVEHVNSWKKLRKDIDQSICLLNHIKSVGF